MAFKEMIAVMFACILANNYVLSSFMGIESVGSDISKSYKNIVFKGLNVTLAIVVSSIVTWPLNAYALVGSASSLRILVFTVVVFAVSGVTSLLFKNEDSCCDIPVALNSVVLGACLISATKGYTFGTAVLAGIGVGIGYTVATLVIAGVMSRINIKYVPRAWRGIPIMVASIAIVSLVLYAF